MSQFTLLLSPSDRRPVLALLKWRPYQSSPPSGLAYHMSSGYLHLPLHHSYHHPYHHLYYQPYRQSSRFHLSPSIYWPRPRSVFRSVISIEMPRTIFLTVFSNGSRPAHYAILPALVAWVYREARRSGICRRERHRSRRNSPKGLPIETNASWCFFLRGWTTSCPWLRGGSSLSSLNTNVLCDVVCDMTYNCDEYDTVTGIWFENRDASMVMFNRWSTGNGLRNSVLYE